MNYRVISGFPIPISTKYSETPNNSVVRLPFSLLATLRLCGRQGRREPQLNCIVGLFRFQVARNFLFNDDDFNLERAGSRRK